MGTGRHKWQGVGAPGRSCCVHCGIFRNYNKGTATYTHRDGTLALNAPKCIPPERKPGGLHECPNGGMCWCTGDRTDCLIKAAGPNSSNPNQLTLF